MTLSRRQLLATGAAGATSVTLLGVAGCTSDTARAGEVGALPGTDRGAKLADKLPPAFTPLLVSTVGTESAPVQCTDGRWRVLYELLVTNAKGAPATLTQLDVVDIDDLDRVVSSWNGQQLVHRVHRLSGTLAGSPNIEPDASRLVFVELVFDSREDVPVAVAHRVHALAAENPGAVVPTPVDYHAAPFDLASRTAAVIGPPLTGGRWLAVNGLDSATGVHRGAVQSVEGRLYDAQRFAVDWMLLGEDGTLVSGNPAEVTNYHGYAQPVQAVAKGRVVEVVDGLPDQKPGTLPRPGEMTLETVDGNHVILEIGDGVFAFYAHLRAGSVQVQKGDSVQAGQQLAEVGNSGNTSGPHLHLHLMTRASALGADSIPYGHDGFQLHGRISEQEWGAARDLAGPWRITRSEHAGRCENQLPLGLSVVSFPEPG